jgi:hypothetical protein
MASFTSFSVTYGELADRTNGYILSFTIDDPAPPANYAIETLYWYNQVGYDFNKTSPVEISETVRPQFFYQGIAVRFSLNYWDTDTFTLLASSSEYNGVLQRKTNDGDCLVMTTPVYFTLIRPSVSQFKSVILPRAPPSGQMFSFKISSSNGCTFCAFMSNISYPLSTTQLTATDSTFSGIFQNPFDINYGFQSNFGTYPLQSSSSPYNINIEFITNSSNYWTISALYAPFLPFIGTDTPDSYYKNDTNNSRMLYYEWTDSLSNSIILSESGQNGMRKDVFVRNLTGFSNTFKIYGASNWAIDDISGSSQYPYVSYGIDANSFATFSFIYRITGEARNLYITNFYNGFAITGLNSNSGTIPDTTFTLTKRVGFVNQGNPSSSNTLTFLDAYQQQGTSRFYTCINAYDISYFRVPTDATGNFFAMGDGTNDIRWIQHPNSFTFFNFATLYNNETNSNIILPLGGFGF